MAANQKEAVVRQELQRLLVQHSLENTVSADDEIVLSYVLGVLECLPSTDDIDETEEVEPFAETMEAYLPGFGIITVSEVGKWMLSTVAKLSQSPESASDSSKGLEDSVRQENSTQVGTASTPVINVPSAKRTSSLPPVEKMSVSCSPEYMEEDMLGQKRVVQAETVDWDSVNALREVCPAASTAELQHCLHLSAGDMEEAASLLLYRQESGTAITKKSETKANKKALKPESSLQNDDSLKDSILAKYSFVDTSEDTTEHRPGLFQKDDKKMIRYREGQVVSTKGERFSEIKKQESEELKKTYVNLKPQRKYRFH